MIDHKVETYNHKDIEPISNDYEAVLITSIDVGLSNYIDIQDLVVGDGSYQRQDAFIHTFDKGCREITIIKRSCDL